MTGTGWAWRELALTAGLAAAASGALFAAGLGGWSGAEDGCLVDGRCFCERDRGGWVRQPANTASNLGFVLVGVAIAASLGLERRRGRHPRPGNPMTETRFWPGAWAVVVALLGPGSMALHASLTRWGSVLDLASMNLFVSFVFLYAWKRWRGLTPLGFAVAFLALDAGLLAVKLVHGRGSEAFGLLALGTLAIELRLRVRDGARADARWLWGAVAVFLLGFGVWWVSGNDGPLCDPDSWLQGHGLWHLTGAATAGMLYLYARSERGREQGSAPGGARPDASAWDSRVASPDPGPRLARSRDASSC